MWGAGIAVADTPDSLFNFKFNHMTTMDSDDAVSQPSLFDANSPLRFSQFDATWTYPWESKNVNVDIGVTLRYLSGFTSNVTQNTSSQAFQQVLPMIHASALLQLPLKGLSAGIEGSHLNIRDTRASDFRAKLSYDWGKGFGLQGGWQHQQFNLENVSSSGADYQRSGPYIDFHLEF